MRIVRDGQKVWPYCSDCGCRLNITPFSNTEYAMTHYGLHPERDNRGHICKSLFMVWVLPKSRLEYFGV